MNNTIRFSALFAIMVALFCGSAKVQAFPIDTYAPTSVLSTGKWVKVGVEKTGVYYLSNATLRSWGFSDPSKVDVFGYGGQRMSDKLSLDQYIDDLPKTVVHRTQSGIYFYAQGVESWPIVSKRYDHSTNPFSTQGFYYLTESSDPFTELEAVGTPNETAVAITTYNERMFHEVDEVSLAHSGHIFVGEDFKYTQSRVFNFDLIGRVPDTDVWCRTAFVSATDTRSTLDFTANGELLEGRHNLAGKGDNTAIRNVYAKTFRIDGNKLSYGITFNPSGTVDAAHLDYIVVNYRRNMELNQGVLDFESEGTTAMLAGADASTIVWDVTDPKSIRRMNTLEVDGGVRWTNPYTGVRRYTAWTPEKASLPTPSLIGTIKNQDLHGITQQPDMVIISVKEWLGEAERIANLHRNSEDQLDVMVINQEDIFNEFSSGVRDVNSLRRFLKMIYDRGAAAGKPLRFALLLGRATFDNRNLLPEVEKGYGPAMPTWQSEDSFSETGTYTSDDILSMLDDNSGATLGSSRISIAIGRIPARSLTQVKNYISKLDAYMNKSIKNEWKNQFVLLADNANEGVFMEDSERQYENMLMNPKSAAELSYTKVYVDAFPIEAGTCVKGRERLYRMIDDGALWINYIGHGAERELADEDIITNADFDNMFNRQFPVMFAATCTFSRWDAEMICGSESMTFNPNGGVIAIIAPTRKALIADNGAMAAAMGGTILRRDKQGKIITLGEMVMNAKNKTVSPNQANMTRLRYTLMGDPALRLVIPSSRVELETVNGEDVTASSQCTLKARQSVTITGGVYAPTGELMSDFNGPLSVTLYDAEYSTTSKGLGDNTTGGKAVTFEEQGQRLFTGRGTVVNGQFTLNIAMPSEISDNFRPAALNMYAYSEDGRDAIGCNRDIYVHGYDDTAAADTLPPVVDYAYLNHESFTPGGVVNEEPMFLAKVSDDTGINMSTAGIGHQMTLKIDDSKSYNDLSLFYIPEPDGSTSGTIAYPMGLLSEGNHTLAFRVWDTSGNSTTHTLNFYVEPGAQPKLFDIFTDANPATTHANFYVSHNRPDATLTLTLDVYAMNGQRVWTTTVTDRSDMFLSAPVTWDLCDMGGHRVTRGIYIYRASLISNGKEVTTQAKRIAVTGH